MKNSIYRYQILIQVWKNSFKKTYGELLIFIYSKSKFQTLNLQMKRFLILISSIY